MKRLTEHTIVRYIIGGGTSACVNLAVFYISNSIFHIHYIVASVLAFAFAFFVSLVFHKYWTFRDHRRSTMRRQTIRYLIASLFGLGLNTCILYIAVHFIHLIPFFGQIVAGALTACCTFFISKHLVFNVSIVVKDKP